MAARSTSWRRRSRSHSRGWPPFVVTAAILAMLLLAACSSGAKVAPTATPIPSATRVPLPTSTPAATVVAITDLNAFRQALASAFKSADWAKVAPLVSPSFTFAGTSTGGAQLVMPNAGSEFKTYYTSNGPWSQLDSSSLGLYSCFVGSTPSGQLMLFGGGNDTLAIAGMQRWQGRWVLAWVFQNAADSSGYCL